MRRPDFFIVGAPKCGTTAMDHYLKQHPEIFMCRKELHFFGSDLRSREPRVTEEKYLSYFSKAKEEKRLGETSVWYLYSKYAAKEIKEYCRFASIIIMLRNPVDMLHSLHSEMLYRFNEDTTNFDEALQLEEQRKRGHRIPRIANRMQGLLYREVVRYTEQILRYIENFGRDHIHFVIYDDLKSNPAKVYRGTLQFLGVRDDFQPAFQVINANKATRNKTLGKFLAIAPRVALRFPESVFPRPMKWALVRLYQIVSTVNTQYKLRTPMDPELRRRFQAEFASEVEQLSKLLGRDLTYWNG